MTDADPWIDRSRLLERIDRLCTSLSEPLSRRERNAGWSPEAAAALLDQLRHARDRLHAREPLDQRDLPSGVQAIRGLDAWGIDVISDSPLLAEVLDLSRELRDFARRIRSERC